MKPLITLLIVIFAGSLIQASELLVLEPDDRWQGAFTGSSNIQTAGYEFTVGESSLSVSAIGVRAHNDRLTNTHNAGIWDSNSNLLASATISPGVGSNGFRFAVLDTPVLLNRHQTYVTGSTYVEGDADHIGISRTFEGASPVYNSAVTFDAVRFGGSVTGMTFPYVIGIPAELGMFGPNLLFDKTNGTMALDWVTLASGAGITATASTPNGELIVAGIFYDEARFEDRRLRGKQYYPEEAVFLAMYSPAGELIFARKVGANVWPTSIAADANGNVVVAFQVLDRIPARFLSRVGTKALRQKPPAWLSAVGMFNKRGNPIWVKKFNCFINTVVAAEAGNYIVGGAIQGTNRIGDETLISWGASDALLAKLDRRGRLSWVDRSGGPGEDGVTAVTVATNGHIFVSGAVGKPEEESNSGPYTATFGDKVLSFDGYYDVFLADYSASGVAIEAFVTGASAAQPLALSLSESNLTVAGRGTALDSTNYGYFVANVNFAAGKLERGIYLTNASIQSILILPDGDIVVAPEAARLVPYSVEKISRKGLLLSRFPLSGNIVFPHLAIGPDKSFYLSGGFFGNSTIGTTNITVDGRQAFMSRIVE